MMFDWWSDHRIGLSEEDYTALKNFTCDLDPENVNAYTDLYITEAMIWDKPANKYRSYIASMIGDLYDLAKGITLTMKKKVVIEPPFSKEYMDNILERIRETLEIRNPKSTFHEVFD